MGSGNRLRRVAPAQGVRIWPRWPTGERGGQQDQPASRFQCPAQGGKSRRVEAAAGIKEGVAVLAPEERFEGLRRDTGRFHRLRPHPQTIAGQPFTQQQRLLQTPRIVAAKYQQTTNALLRHPRRQVK